MKNIKKILLFLLIAVLAFSLTATFAFAEEAPESDTPAGGENSTKEDIGVKSYYTDEEGNVIIVFEDGTEVNLGKAEEKIDTDADFSINIDGKRFVDSLQYMWKGMLGIFIVIGVIILSVYVMNKLSTLSFKKDDEE